MDRAQLYKLTELIVAEVVRRIAQEERRTDAHHGAVL